MKPPAARITPWLARTSFSFLSISATTPTTRPSSAVTSVKQSAFATVLAPAWLTPAMIFCMIRPPASPSVFGLWPRGAGFAFSLKGNAASFPE